MGSSIRTSRVGDDTLPASRFTRQFLRRVKSVVALVPPTKADAVIVSSRPHDFFFWHAGQGVGAPQPLQPKQWDAIQSPASQP